jgi:hypothetical protein
VPPDLVATVEVPTKQDTLKLAILLEKLHNLVQRPVLDVKEEIVA